MTGRAELSVLDLSPESTHDGLGGHVVGAPATVVERFQALQRVTGAEEILVTTATYRAADRLRS